MYVCVRTVAQRRLRPKHDDCRFGFFSLFKWFCVFFLFFKSDSDTRGDVEVCVCVMSLS